MRRWLLLIFCGAFLMGFLAAGAFPITVPTTGSGDRPNVVIIQADSMRADHLGVYGYDRNTSPNIDQFARESVVFTDAITRSLWQLTGHVSLFTSLYAVDLGLRQPPLELIRNYQLSTHSPGAFTIFGLFDEKGYSTAAVVGTWPKGWPQFREEKAYVQGVDQYFAPGPLFNQTVPVALRWIRDHQSEPFLVYLSSHGLHTPLEYPKPYEHMFSDSYQGVIDNYSLSYIPLTFGHYRRPYLPQKPPSPAILDDITVRNGSYVIAMDNRTIPLSARDMEHIRAHYDGGVRMADHALGEFFERLKEMGEYNDTIIVLMADNGQNLGNHVDPRGNLFSLYQVYDHTIRIPLIIKAPGFEHRRVTKQAELVDIMATILDIAGIPVNNSVKRQMRGDPLTPLMRGKNVSINPYVFSLGAFSSQAVRTTHWKFIARDAPNWSDELYNLRKDPDETENVIDKHPKVAERLRNKLRNWEHYFPRPPRQALGPRASGHSED